MWRMLWMVGLVWAGVVSADTAVLIDESKDASYLVEVRGGKITFVPLAGVVRPGVTQPNPPTVPPTTPGPVGFGQQIEAETRSVLSAGGSKTTASGISAVYSLVSSGVGDGSIPIAKVWDAVALGTDTVLGVQDDREKWVAWRTGVTAALRQLHTQGKLGTQAEVVAILKETAAGIDRATGANTLPPKRVAAMTAAELSAHDASDGKADGILDGIDLTKLAGLIRLILELLKLFGIAG